MNMADIGQVESLERTRRQWNLVAGTQFSMPQEQQAGRATTLYSWSRAPIRIEAPSVPAWLSEAKERIDELLSLQEDWNSYGAIEIDRRAATTALRLLARIMDDGSPAPAIVPTASGGVQLEWHTMSGDLEIEIPRRGPLSLFFERIDPHTVRDQSGDFHEISSEAADLLTDFGA